MLSCMKDCLTLAVNCRNGTVEFRNHLLGVSFKQVEQNRKVTKLLCENGKISFLTDCNGLRLLCVYEIKSDETGSYVNLDIHATGKADADSDVNVREGMDTVFEDGVCYPPAIQVTAKDREIDAYCEGVAFMVEDEIPVPQVRSLCAGHHNSMSFWGIARKEAWILCAVITNADANLITQKGEHGLARTQVQWIPEMGKWGYTRTMRFYLGKGNPVSDMCRTYRKVAEQRGLVKTFCQKVQENPAIDRLAGSANVWLWNSDAMEKLYSENAVYRIPDEAQLSLRRSIASEMKALGMEHVLWSVFDENVDRETVEHVKKLGYLTTYYDIYTDVISEKYADMIPETRRRRCAHRMEYWPKGIVVKQDGQLCDAWALKGIDGKFYPQNKMCDSVVCDCARKYVAEHGIANGLEGVFIDVTLVSTAECYSKEHPQTRRQAIAHKNELFEMLHEMGMFCGSEIGHEDAVRNVDYNEGMMSPPSYRFYDAGRRMTHIYQENQIEEKVTKLMLNPKLRVPLWEMVYHDCHASYWYWGDSSNCAPSLMPVRNLFNMLYGQAPIFSFSVDHWAMLKEKIAASYQKTVPLARQVRYARMISFEYLTENMMVQRTVFDNGVEVVVNFGDEDYDWQGKKIPAMDAVIINETKIEKSLLDV